MILGLSYVQRLRDEEGPGKRLLTSKIRRNNQGHRASLKPTGEEGEVSLTIASGSGTVRTER